MSCSIQSRAACAPRGSRNPTSFANREVRFQHTPSGEAPPTISPRGECPRTEKSASGNYGQYAPVAPLRNSEPRTAKSPRPVLPPSSKSVSCAAGLFRKLLPKIAKSPRPVVPSVPSMSVERPLTVASTTPSAETSTPLVLLNRATREAKFTAPLTLVTRLIVFAGQLTVVPAFWTVKTFITVAEKSSLTVL